MLSELDSLTAVGGRGCENCMYWNPYGPLNLSLYSLVGKWGRCNNPDAVDALNKKFLTQQTSSEDRVNVVITRLTPGLTVASTTPTYSCNKMRLQTNNPDKGKTE